jgi:hypothetical protein
MKFKLPTGAALNSIILFFSISCFLISCGEKSAPVKKNIGSTGFTIDLPATYKLAEQSDSNYVVYFITPLDTSISKGGGGIYFGPAPDEHGPPNIVSKKESAGTTFGKKSKTIEYITPTYTWIETVIDETEGKKIQTWYFAYTPEELADLARVMKTIARKN